MNAHRTPLSACLALIACAGCLTAAATVSAPPPGTTLKVYHLGNSLTRNLPLQRLQKLFESAGGSYLYGTQLGGGIRLDQHLVKRGHPGPPGSGEYNTIAPYGEYDKALRNYTFDALIMQPHQQALDIPAKSSKGYPFFVAGDLQAASAFIDYALGQTKPGTDRWDFAHANTNHVATERFYIYATWPPVDAVLAQDGEKTYAHYYALKYTNGVQSCEDYYEQLVTRLNALHPGLEVPVRMIPAGEVMAVLDGNIRAGRLPGIATFYRRNQAYYRKARRNNPKPSPYDPDEFDAKAGVLNFYADGVHMNDQPHDGKDSGTIGSYVAALTVYATLSGMSPVGMTVAPYEMFDAKADGALIKALQETVWQVVTNNPYSGVPGASQAKRRPASWAQPIQLDGVPNLHMISSNLYRSAQPTAEGMRNLRKMGIKTIINLRSFHSDKDEIGKEELEYERMRVETWHPERSEAVEFLSIVADTNRAPVLVHCQHGADRTGAMCALYRIVFEGWTKDEAIREMKEGGYGFHPVWRNLPEWIRTLDSEVLKREAGLLVCTTQAVAETAVEVK